MNTMEKVMMNLKIRPDGMNLYELDRMCFTTYQKTLVGSKLGRVKDRIEPILRYLEETNQITIREGIVRLKRTDTI
ncbi:hypothetical protein [Clostridium beijerinckii]|uniref:hypothetical protein n=1 Tax=Clostridium beijerinckii TaxID=1520 RepID=UPI00047ACF09|nr:hypothetical protein [Clostridium beijerinckii]